MASTASVAAGYSPLTGLYVNSPGLNPGAAGRFTSGAAALLKPTSFTNPNAPTNTPTNTPPPITGAGAYTPDWANLIQNDTGFKDAAAALAAGNAGNQTQLNSQLVNAYESFGKNVDLATLANQLGMSQAGIQSLLGSPEVQKLTQENTDAGTSTTARLDQANQQAIRSVIANLNKRGILHSGEASYQLDQQNLGYRQAQSDAYQKLLGYLQQYQSGYLAAQQANAGKLADAYSSAADRVRTYNQSSPGVTATPDHQDATGAWVYKGTDGNFYNADGSPYKAPQDPPPPPSATDVLAGLPSRASYGGPRVAA